jgi:hypothetical protein
MRPKSTTPSVCLHCNTPFFHRADHRPKYCGVACAAASRVRPVDERLREKTDRSGGPDACWPWGGKRDGDGYGKIWIGQGEQLAHRVAYTVAKGPIPDGLIIRHTCDNPPCCNPRHLLTGTRTDNSRDRVERKHSLKGREGWNGATNGRAKLTDDLVIEIRARYAAGETQIALGQSFGVHNGTISSIVRRKTWQHLP